MLNLRGGYLREADRDYQRPIVTRRYVDPIDMFDRHTYNKGALVLHMIHFLLGEEGWSKGIHAYVERFAGQTVTTADLQDSLEKATGVSLGAVFDQYVYGAGHPELKVKWDYQKDTRQVHLEIRQTQKLGGETGLFSFPLDIALVGERETATRRVRVAARDFQDLYLPSEERPRTVVLDPQGWILKTVDLTKPAAEWAIQLTASRPLAAKVEAIRALGDLGGDEAVAALGKALREEPFHGARREAAKALGKIQKDSALEALRAGLADKDSRVRSSAFEALGSFPEHAELIPVLKHALETDDSYAVRAGAASSLGSFEKSRAQASPILVAALSQASHQQMVSGAAIKALAELDPDRAWEPAQRMAKYGAPIESRSEALDALVTIAKHDRHRHDEVRKILEGYLDDPYYSHREATYRRLGELGDPASIPAIEHRSRLEADSRQRRNAEKAVQRILTGKEKEREDQALRDRVEQLERETELLKEQVRMAGEKKGGG